MSDSKDTGNDEIKDSDSLIKKIKKKIKKVKKVKKVKEDGEATTEAIETKTDHVIPEEVAHKKVDPGKAELTKAQEKKLAHLDGIETDKDDDAPLKVNAVGGASPTHSEPAPLYPNQQQQEQQQQQQQQHDKHAQQPIIIIKRIKRKAHNKHHGGSWKIAYADFVTAMMTFFLLMWLLSMLNKYQLQGISDYFKRPIKTIIVQQDTTSTQSIKTEQSETSKMPPKPQSTLAAAIKSLPKEEQDKRASERIKADLERQLEKNPQLSQYKNMLNFVVTAQGLKIQIHDLENKAMFSTGKTDFSNYASMIIDWLASTLNTYPNRVMIVGHTDNKPYKNDPAYSNWELSADRANATRRELISHGMQPDKIVRIVGEADANKLKTAVDGSDPANRRIDIIILNDKAYTDSLNQ